MEAFSMGKPGALSPPCSHYLGCSSISRRVAEATAFLLSYPASPHLLHSGFTNPPSSFRNAHVYLVTPMPSSHLPTLRISLSLSSEIIRRHFCAVRKPFGPFRKTISEKFFIVITIFLFHGPPFKFSPNSTSSMEEIHL